MKCLDIGCGPNKTAGCDGIDIVELNGVDIVHDLSILPWPIANETYEKIISNHFLEHSFNIVDTIKEIHRIMKSGSTLHIRVPHYASDNFNSDLTHKTRFGYRSFDHFAINGNVQYTYYEKIKFEILYRRIKFMSPTAKYDIFKWMGIEYLVNQFPRMYERFFVYWLVPSEIIFILKKV